MCLIQKNQHKRFFNMDYKLVHRTTLKNHNKVVKQICMLMVSCMAYLVKISLEKA